MGASRPESWLSTNFVERCAALPVIWVHPEPGKSLDSEKFRKDNVGSIWMPYVKTDEVWGIAKIYDEPAAQAILNTPMSTSPGVTPPQGAKAIPLESGHKVLDEPLPRILDHLAICELGVWDKGGPPEGIRIDALDRKDETVTEEEKKALEKERDDARARADAAEKERDDAKKRADEMEMADKARKDAEEAEEKKREDKSKRDAAEKEKMDAAKRDSRKDRHSKHDGIDKGEVLDCAKCDAEEKAEEEEREDKKRKDAAAKVAEVEANAGMDDIKDSVTIKHMQAQIDALTAAAKPLEHDAADKIAAAFHRADSVFGMFGERAPQHMPGELPKRYDARLASALQKLLPETSRYKTAVFNDSLPEQAFGLMRDELDKELLTEAKSPTRNDAVAERLIPRITRDELGRTRTEYHGSSRLGLGLFVAPSFVGKIVKPERV